MLLKYSSIALLAVLATAAPASAGPLTFDFLVFSGGGTTGSDAGDETSIAGASLFIGDIGSNWDLSIGASETFVLGSVYAGGTVDLAPRIQIGSDGTQSFIALESPLGNTFPTFAAQYEAVVANSSATIRDQTTIFGTLDAASLTSSGTPYVSGTETIGAGAATFGAITLTQTSFAGFTVTQGNQECTTSGCTSLTIDPNTLATAYNDLLTGQDRDVYLRSGTYYFDDIIAGSDLDLYIDLTNGPVTIYVRDDATFGQDTELYVKGAGTNGQYVLIRDASDLAALIKWEIGDVFTLGGGTGNTGGWGSIFGGYVYSSGTGVGISVGQHIDWYGSLYAYDTIDLADHSRYTYVPASGGQAVPEPTSLLLLGTGLLIGAKRLKRSSKLFQRA